MKRLIALLLVLTLLPLPSVFAEKEPANQVIPQEAYDAVTEDVWDDIVALEDKEVLAKRGADATEQDYAAIVEKVAAAVEASDTYVEDSLNRNGAFLTWETTEGVVCGYSPRMRAQTRQAKAPRTDTALDREETVSFATKNSPTASNVAVFQPYYGLDDSFTDQYQEEGARIAGYTGGSYTLYTGSNASISNIAKAVQNSAVVVFDSHGDTDYYNPYNALDCTSRANTSYILLQTGAGLTAKDQGMATGTYGNYYHAFYGGVNSIGMQFYYVDGTVIANHMTKSAPNNLVWMATCLGMATEGLEKPLMKKGVGVTYGYSQAVTFANDYLWEQTFWSFIRQGYDVGNSIAFMKEYGGSWDLSPKLYDYYGWYYDEDTAYTISQARSTYCAFPIVVSASDYYPGKGNVDNLQTVYSDWTLPSGCAHTTTYEYVVDAMCEVPGTISEICSVCGMMVSSKPIPATGHSFDGGYVSIPSTESTPGEYVYTCLTCGATMKEVIPPNQSTPESCPSADFTDVHRTYWYHPYVDYALSTGMMNGVGSHKFDPEGALTRAMLVTILYRISGNPSVEGLSHPFTDVPANLWYSNAVTWAYDQNIVNGVSKTSFAPDDKITREQIVTILYRYNGGGLALGNLSDYPDGNSVSGYARDAMAWAIGAKIINGSDGMIAPQENATRCQVAKILYCYLEDFGKGWKKEYGEALKSLKDSLGSEMTAEYALYDVGNDGIPELFICKGTSEADMEIDIYSFDPYMGLYYITNLTGGHTVLCGWTGHRGLLIQYQQMGYESLTHVYMEDSKLNSVLLYEGIVGGHDPLEPLQMYPLSSLTGLNWDGNPTDNNDAILAPIFNP